MPRKNQSPVPEPGAGSSELLIKLANKKLAESKKLGIMETPAETFPLVQWERQMIATLPAIPAELRAKLKGRSRKFTLAEIAHTLKGVAKSVVEGELVKRISLLSIANKLADCLRSNINASNMTIKSPKTESRIFQFKITLLHTKPAIWRRIQVRNGTLDELHEHIQTAMGWTNSHLHQFHIKEKRCGDPELLGDDFEEVTGMDSTRTMLSDLIPENAKSMTFRYEYDFGDGWEHEIRFEGMQPADPKVKYPVCIEGKRACPPEDCGGTWGYEELQATIGNPKHQDHEGIMEWLGGSFDPEAFDPADATKAMKKGLPDWRRMG